MMRRCAFDQNQLQVRQPRVTARPCWIKRDDGASLPPRGPFGCTESPGRVCEEINRMRSTKATSFDRTWTKKKIHQQASGQRAGKTYSIHLFPYISFFFLKKKRGGFIFPGDLFNEMTSFLQDSVVNGFHTTLLPTGGFRALAGKRAISSPGVSAVSPAAIWTPKRCGKTLYTTVHGIRPCVASRQQLREELWKETAGLRFSTTNTLTLN